MAVKKEIWKSIRGHKGSYEISNLSRLRSSPKFGNHYIETMIQPILHETGYMVVSLHKNGGRKMHHFHRLVAKAFIKNPKKRLYINHKNGKKTDNRICNLQWCTAKENIEHAIKMGLRHPPSGGSHPHARKIGKYNNGKLLKSYSYIGQVVEDDFSREGVKKSLAVGWKHKGFDWKYLDESNKKVA